MLQDIEHMYSLTELCSIFNVSRNLAGRLFCGRPGVINLSTGAAGRPAYRVPTSVIIDVMVERGYTREMALALLQRLPLVEARHV